MTPEVRRLITRASVVTAGVGVVFSPIPLLDELVLFPVLCVISARIARHHALDFAHTPWRPILKNTAIGLLARGAVNLTVAVVPGVSSVASAATAAGLTEILGRYVDQACADPAQAQPLTVRGVIDTLRRMVSKKTPAVSAS